MANRWKSAIACLPLLLGISGQAASQQANTGQAGTPNTATPARIETFAVPGAEAGNPAPVQEVNADQPGKRIALLLPLRSESLGAAAEAIRQGFMAGFENESEGVTVNVVESGENAADILDSYQLAMSQHDVLVGPLPRAGVSALLESGVVRKPTVALNQAETRPGEVGSKIPPNFLMVGLSIEDEARQLANWAASSHGHSRPKLKAIILSSNIAWQKRAAKAFAAQWQKLGHDAVQQEIYSSSGFLSAAGLAQLKNRLQPQEKAAEKTEGKPEKTDTKPEPKLPDQRPQLIFVAMDAEQTRQLRQALQAGGTELPIYATSQINRNTLVDGEENEALPFLDGIRLLEVPWQLQRDHPAVMIYPRLIQSGEQKRSADLERLYALGIDAFRIARQLALQPGKKFELDGVTGKLIVDNKKGAYSFERISQTASYRQGILQALNPAVAAP